MARTWKKRIDVQNKDARGISIENKIKNKNVKPRWALNRRFMLKHKRGSDIPLKAQSQALLAGSLKLL